MTEPATQTLRPSLPRATPEQLAEAHRCCVCRSGRRHLLRAVPRPDRNGVRIACAGCYLRFGERLPVPRPLAPKPATRADTLPKERSQLRASSGDRLGRALPRLPHEFSLGEASRRARVPAEKVLPRLEALAADGKLVRLGPRRWRKLDGGLSAAFDRLAATAPASIRVVVRREGR